MLNIITFYKQVGDVCLYNFICFAFSEFDVHGTLLGL